MFKPLDTVRVLDLTNVLAGPFCCHQLVHLGAEVIKVEQVGQGDLARQLGADPALNEAGMGVSFLAQNAGKQSIALNLKDARGKALFKRLLATADVVVENFRPGVMTRLGLDYDTLKQIKPSLIYCAISGFGQDGPWRDRPAYDQIVQGVSGTMSVTGEAGGRPLRVGFPVADTIGGLTAALAISAALNQARASGEGAFLDVSMLEASVACMGWVASDWLVAGVQPSAHGNDNVTASPSGAFQTGDGVMNIAANKDEQWRLLMKHLGLAELIDHDDYADRDRRKANRQALTAQIEAALASKSAVVWADQLNALGVPAGVVMTVPDVLNSAQVADRGMVARFDAVPGVGRDIHLLRTGIKINGEAPGVDSPPPQLGQHSDDILSALGLNADEIAVLRADRVI